MGTGYRRAFGNSPQVVTVVPALSPDLWLLDTPQPRDNPGDIATKRRSNTHTTAFFRVSVQALGSLAPAFSAPSSLPTQQTLTEHTPRSRGRLTVAGVMTDIRTRRHQGMRMRPQTPSWLWKEDFPEEVTSKGQQGFGRSRRGWARTENACQVERAAAEAACVRGCERGG